MWLIYGEIPAQLGERLLPHQIYLHAIDTIFYTDLGKNKVTATFDKVGNFPEELVEKIDQIQLN